MRASEEHTLAYRTPGNRDLLWLRPNCRQRKVLDPFPPQSTLQLPPGKTIPGRNPMWLSLTTLPELHCWYQRGPLWSPYRNSLRATLKTYCWHPWKHAEETCATCCGNSLNTLWGRPETCRGNTLNMLRGNSRKTLRTPWNRWDPWNKPWVPLKHAASTFTGREGR